ncbi:MAG: FAD-binding protein [Thermoplasmatota archaeon]
MDKIDLALNPTKANRRFSPFSKSLSKGMVRRLEYAYGERATGDPNELAIASRDASAVPGAIQMALKRQAWAVVRPATRGDLFGIIKFAEQNLIPVVPRGAGTSGYGGAVPTEGGIVVDMRGIKSILSVDAAKLTVTIEPGIRFLELDRLLKPHGLALRQYPTSGRGSTVGGWIATGGGGVGSLKYGPFRNDIVSVTMIRADGKEVRLEGSELDLVNSAWGITGIIVEATLKVRKADTIVPFLAEWETLDAACEAASRLAGEGGFHLAINPQEYSRAVNEAAKQKLLPQKANVLFAMEVASDAAAAEAEGSFKGIVEDTGGTVHKPDAAKKAWDARFDHLNVKRLGPSVVVSEAVVDIQRAAEAFRVCDEITGSGLQDTGQERQFMWAIAIGPTEVDLIYYRLEDERRVEYSTALGNSLAFLDGAKRVGGRSYNTGVLLANEAKAVLGAERVKRLRAYKRATDKADIMNPGPVLGARMRGVPARVFPFFMSVNAPALKLVRRISKYPGQERWDPSFEAVQVALADRAAGADLATLDYEVTTCIFCANCNDAAPEGPHVGWETALPRGRVQAANALLRGKTTPTRHLHEQASLNPLSYAPDGACPTLIPIARVTDLLLATCVQTLGALPEHVQIAEAVAKEGNVLGKPRDKRNAWTQSVPWDPDSKTILFADDIASYDANDHAQALARVASNADVQVSHIGKTDTTSGATLVETGQRAAAQTALKDLFTDIKKKKIEAILSPDANAVRVIRYDWNNLAEAAGIEDFPTLRVMHSSEAIAGWIKGKRLEVATKWEKKAIWHAPEALEAKERAFGADVLKALGAKLIEGPNLECGHGRALDKRAPQMQQKIAETALRAAVDAGAEAIVTANPGCALLLRSAAKKAKVQVEVVDLVTLVSQNMKMREGGGAVAVTVAPAVPEKPAEPEIPPDHFRVEFVKEGVVLAVHKNKTLLEAGEEAGLELPSSCRAGSCDTCSAKWEGTAADQSIGVALTADQQKKYVLTCIAKPRGAINLWSNERPG